MENDIQDSLEDVGYQGPMLEEDIFNQAVEEGSSSVEYTKLVEWITTELSGYTGIDDKVNEIKSKEDEENFLLELSGFLRELGCPYSVLSEGPLTKRLDQKQNRLFLLDFLLTELQALKITTCNKPQMCTQAMETETSTDSDTATHLKQMLITLGFPKPPENITSFQLFSKVEAKIKELIAKVQPAHLSKPLLKARLSDKQWEVVEYIGTALHQEYETRRDMMLKRLDVTIQSFKWSDRAKKRGDEIAASYQPIRRNLTAKGRTDMAHLIAAREDLLSIQKTSSGLSREKTKCPINRVMIGKVPDRGGRAYEHDVPPPEMPSFQKRQAAPQQQRQHGGGRGGHDGRRVQGGWGGDGRNQQGGSSWGSNQQQPGAPAMGNPAAGFFGGAPQQQGYQAFSGDQYNQMGYQGQGGYHGQVGGGGGSHGGYQGGNEHHGGQGYQGGGYQGGGGRGGRGGGRGRGRGGRGR